MNTVEVKVKKIRSYQTLVSKIGKRSYRTKEYNAYIQEVGYQINKLTPIPKGIDIKLTLHFKNKTKVIGDIDNITKPIQDILQISGKVVDDKDIRHLDAKISTGHKATSIVIEIEEIS